MTIDTLSRRGRPSLSTGKAADDRPNAASFRLFFLWLFCLPTLAWIAAFPIARSHSFERWAATRWGPVLEYAFDEKRQDADIVLFGDSSAFLGVDPAVVQAQLGRKTIVLPGTIGSLPVTGDSSLVTYLQHNRPPRVIVFYFSTWNLDFHRTAPTRLFEGEEMLVRHGTMRQILAFEEHHPLELLSFPFRLYSTFGPKMIHAAMRHEDREAATEKAFGHADYPDPNPPLARPCSIPASYMLRTSDDAIRELVRKYSTDTTRVMVYLAPVPECTNSDRLVQQSFLQVGAAPPVVMPPQSFADDLYYAHILPSSVPEASRLFAQALARSFPNLSLQTAQPALQPVR